MDKQHPTWMTSQSSAVISRFASKWCVYFMYLFKMIWEWFFKYLTYCCLIKIVIQSLGALEQSRAKHYFVLTFKDLKKNNFCFVKVLKVNLWLIASEVFLVLTRKAPLKSGEFTVGDTVCSYGGILWVLDNEVAISTRGLWQNWWLWRNVDGRIFQQGQLILI